MRKYTIKSDAAPKSLINYRELLNDEQRAVAAAGAGPILVIAGAGSGKTRTVTYRVARLIEAGVAPARILLVTFTNRAAREMLSRVEGLLGADVRRVWGGTFHSIANRLLRRHAVSLGYQNNFSILDAEDAKDLIDACIEEAAIDTKARRFPKGEVLREMFSYATNTDTPLEQTIVGRYPQFEPLAAPIARVDRLYQSRKLERNAMDYDDLLVNWKRLMSEKPEIAAIYQEQFQHILVDEYQDTNTLQAEIVDLVAAKHRNLMVVGDDAQCVLPETEIMTEAGAYKVTSLKLGSRVIAANGFGSTGDFSIIEKFKRHYRGNVITVTTKAGRTVRLTPEHICYARLQPKEGQWYVYLMYRSDKGFRLGVTRGIRHPGKTEVNGLLVRANQERADKMWIILTTDSKAEAIYYEELLSLKYGVPKIMFYVLNRGRLSLRQEQIDRLFSEIDTVANAERLMEDFLLFKEYPHARPQAITSEMSKYYPGRCQAYLIQFGDSREDKMLPWHAHRVRLTTASKPIHEKLRNGGVALRDDKHSKRVETSRKHFADAHDLAQKVSCLGEVDLCKLARLTKAQGNFSWQPASHLRVGMLVPTYEDGKIETDEIVSITAESYEGDVYDLNVEHVNNFIANGIVLHNSIFGWRGANFSNIYRFRDRYPDAQVLRLETNYRSTPEILMLANASVANNRKQFPKNLQAVRPSRNSTPAMIPARDAEQQAAFVASRILELRDEGVPLDEIAVLYRSHFHSLEVQMELVRRGIPYDVRSGVRFFEQAHIKDVTAYLRLVVNPRDELAWKRVLKLVPKIGNATAARVWEKLAYAAEPLALVRAGDFTESLPKNAMPGLREFAGLIRDLIAPETIDHPAKQIELVLERGYLEYLLANYENADAREEDLRQLANYAGRFDATDAFLSELALINTERFAPPGATVGEDVVMGGDGDEHLALSSIHQAKGLEWRAVFLIWAADGKFPSARSLRDAEGEEEERRLFYVALTRAKDELYICYPLIETDRARQTVLHRPSRFITEIPKVLFEVWEIDEQQPSFELDEVPEPKLIN